jgi:hypothetical protein
MLQANPGNCPVVLATPAQAFFHLVIRPGADTYRLSFSVKAESNIRCYIIEGSHDLMSFDRITRVYAKGNSALPSSYSITIRNTDYSYYRVRQIDNATASTLNSEDLLEPGAVVQETHIQACAGQEIPVMRGGTHIQGAFF